MSQDALVVFTPSGRRGRFAVGTSVLQAARSLGVDIDSVCGGHGLCGRCQVEPTEGRFEKHGITKDRFVIGRGKQSSDLTLKDPNVSRQHAMIEYQNGIYFMVDMGIPFPRRTNQVVGPYQPIGW